jgi:secreted PhoX family phosphatase
MDKSGTAAAKRHNMTLLEHGTLYVAKFTGDGEGDGEYDGTGRWIRLCTDTESFVDGMEVADVLIDTRLAADAAGATAMDPPEDVEPNPVTGKVYAAMTNNNQRGAEGRPAPDRANPRATNNFGHIIEWAEDGGNHASTSFRWEIFLLAGPTTDETRFFAGFPKEEVSPIAAPDNIAFDTRGNLWIATDGQPSAIKVNDSIHGVATEGPERGKVKQLLSGPVGSEVASLVLNTDDTALFASIQHPGEGGKLDQPTSTWPTGSMARPAVIVVSSLRGAPIGG